MREIKFRAWDKENNKMIIPNEMSSRQPLMTWLGGNVYKEGVLQPYIMLQYTGLKDKNGKEIYEGDIMVSFPYTVLGHSKTHYSYKAFVDFDYGKFKLNYIKGGSDHARPGLGAEFEIIGNIYENPELELVK